MYMLMPFFEVCKALSDWYSFVTDFSQRSILFGNTMVQRGVQTLKSKDFSNVVNLPYEIIMSGKELGRPTNYDLIKLQRPLDSSVTKLRPVIGVSPRASRLSGVEILMPTNQGTVAMDLGHEVYWIVFERNPVPGQTIEDVIWTIGEFIKKVNSLHPQDPKGSIVAANCQSGWASFFRQLECEKLPFTLIPIASPLSYHSGCSDRSMRFFAGLTGGCWPVAASGDLEKAFDGANLASNFERHSGPGAIFGKFLRTFLSIDESADNFLLMERWWNLYSIFGPEELPWILENLFVGNYPENGLLVLDGKPADMKDHNETIVILCSNGDDIATPAACLSWIKKIYISVDALKESGKRIIFLIHPNAGHLKIFLSGTVALEWLGGILANIESLEKLPGGLYRAEPQENMLVVTEVSFDDLPRSSAYEEDVLQKIATFSEQTLSFYKTWTKPLLQLAHPFLGKILRRLHPLRVQRYPFIGAEFNPLFRGLNQLAPVVRKWRVEIGKDNCFFNTLCETSNSTTTLLNFWNTTFSTANDFFVQMLFGLTVPATTKQLE